jgi:hypothetical protein
MNDGPRQRSNIDHTYANAAPQVDLVGDPVTDLNDLARQARE